VLSTAGSGYEGPPKALAKLELHRYTKFWLMKTREINKPAAQGAGFFTSGHECKALVPARFPGSNPWTNRRGLSRDKKQAKQTIIKKKVSRRPELTSRKERGESYKPDKN